MELLIAFGVTLLTQFVKGFVFKRWGAYGVYAVVFALALGGTVVYQYVYSIPEWKVIITHALETLAYAVALYEVILSKIGFSGGTKLASTSK